MNKANITREAVAEAIFHALGEVNQLLPKKQQIRQDLDTELLGMSSNLDSLGLVNLVVASEHKIEDVFGVEISLLDEGAMLAQHSPFKTIGSMVDYTLQRLERKPS